MLMARTVGHMTFTFDKYPSSPVDLTIFEDNKYGSIFAIDDTFLDQVADVIPHPMQNGIPVLLLEAGPEEDYKEVDRENIVNMQESRITVTNMQAQWIAIAAAFKDALDKNHNIHNVIQELESVYSMDRETITRALEAAQEARFSMLQPEVEE